MVVPLWARDHDVDSSRYGSSVARRVASPTVGLSASVRANDWHPVSNLLLFLVLLHRPWQLEVFILSGVFSL